MSLYRGWAITIRPRDGITSAQITSFLDWVDGPRSGVLGCTAVTEGINECRHLHAAVYLVEPRRKDAVVRAMKGIQGCTDRAEERVLSQGVKILYSPDFEEVYLTKNEDGHTVELLSCRMSMEDRLACLPSQEEQDAVQMATNSADKYFHQLALEFTKTEQIPHVEAVEDFLHAKMFVDKTMRVLRLRRDRRALRDTLTGYLSGKKADLW